MKTSLRSANGEVIIAADQPFKVIGEPAVSGAGDWGRRKLRPNLP